MKKLISLILFLFLLTSISHAAPDGAGNEILTGSVYQGAVGTPSASLHLFDSSDPKVIWDTGGTDWHIGLDDSNGDALAIGTAQTIGSSSAITFETGGEVGILSTSPAEKLFITNGLNVALHVGKAVLGSFPTSAFIFSFAHEDNYSTSNYAFLKNSLNSFTTINTPTGQDIDIAINGSTTSVLFMDGSTVGNMIGIGSTHPDYLCDVTGDVYLDTLNADTTENALKQNNTTGVWQKDIAELFSSENGYLGAGSVAALNVLTKKIEQARQNSIVLGPTAILPAILIEGSWMQIQPNKEKYITGQKEKSPVALLGQVPIDTEGEVKIGDVIVIGPNGKGVVRKPGESTLGYVGLALNVYKSKNQVNVLTGHHGLQLVLDEQQKDLNSLEENSKNLHSRLNKLRKAIK